MFMFMLNNLHYSIMKVCVVGKTSSRPYIASTYQVCGELNKQLHGKEESKDMVDVSTAGAISMFGNTEYH